MSRPEQVLIVDARRFAISEINERELLLRGAAGKWELVRSNLPRQKGRLYA